MAIETLARQPRWLGAHTLENYRVYSRKLAEYFQPAPFSVEPLRNYDQQTKLWKNL
jgi:hypothetical protein